MTWVIATLISAFFLGVYDLLKKHAVHGNAVLPVLFLSTVAMAVVWSAFLFAEAVSPGCLPAQLRAEPITGVQHLQMLAKSAIVTLSWILSYFALKHLPVSLAAPIRATGPIWTLVGALVIYVERPSLLETLGIVITLGSFVGLSFAGRKDGITLHRNKWVGFMVLGTLAGAVSGLYDKYLFGHAGFNAPTVQAWFSIYLALLFLPLAIGWKRRWWQRGEFQWRWSIPLIGLTLLIADYIYFDALRNPDAMISVVSSLRRGSTLVAFSGGLLFFGEKNGWAKLPAVLGVVAGIVLCVLG